jgi:hypothetical protein
LRGDFISTVQKRGAAIIAARGASSAGSAANAIVDSVVSVATPTPTDDWHSLAIPSDGSYGIEEGLICSFPTRSNGQAVEIVQGVELGHFQPRESGGFGQRVERRTRFGKRTFAVITARKTKAHRVLTRWAFCFCPKT